MKSAISSILSNARIKLAVCALALIIVATLAATTRAWLPPVVPQELSISAIQESPALPANAPRRGPVQNLRFALYETELLPREAVAQKGFVALTIEDFTGGGQGLVVERLAGNAPERVGRIERVEGHGRGKSELELKPGTYEVYDLSRPENRARLTIEP